MANVEHIMEADFEAKVLKSSLPVLVDFFAEWCGPCRMMAPVLDQLAGKTAGQIAIYKMDTDHNQTLATQYQITGIPCLIFFKQGQEVKRLTGYQSEQNLLTQIQSVL